MCILLNVAKKHTLIGCEIAKKVQAADEKRYHAVNNIPDQLLFWGIDGQLIKITSPKVQSRKLIMDLSILFTVRKSKFTSNLWINISRYSLSFTTFLMACFIYLLDRLGSLHKLRLHLGVARWSEKCLLMFTYAPWVLLKMFT